MFHDVVVDEATDHEGGAMFRAYCTDECGWQGDRWHHADEYAEDVETHPCEAAYEAADADRTEHLEAVST